MGFQLQIPPTGTLEGRFVDYSLLIVGMMVAVGILAVWRGDRRHVKLQIASLAGVTGVLLFVFAAIFAMERPYYPGSIALNIIESLFFLGFLAYPFWFFAEARLFAGSAGGFVFRSFFIGFGYVIFSTIMYSGLDFLFKDIINPAAVPLNPQFYSVAVPITVFLALFFYRVKVLFKSAGFRFLGEIFRDFVFFSFSVFFLQDVVNVSGAGTRDFFANLPTLPWEIGLYIALLGLSLEAMALLAIRKLERYRGAISLDSMAKMFVEPWLSRLEKQHALDEFVPTHKQETSLSRFSAKLDRRLSFKVKGRRFKGSWIFTILVLVLLVSTVYVSVAKVSFTAEVPDSVPRQRYSVSLFGS